MDPEGTKRQPQDVTLESILSDITETLSSEAQKRSNHAREILIKKEMLPALADLISPGKYGGPVILNLQLDSGVQGARMLVQAYRACYKVGIFQKRKVHWKGSPELLRYLSAAEGKILTGPRMVQINIANRCNLDCIFCWVHTPFAPPMPREWQKTKISMPLFKKIVSGLGRIETGGVIFSGQGEPFIHPQIYEMIKLVKQEGIKLYIQTNLHLVDVERVSSLGVDALHVNLSAASEETYRSVHPSQKREAFTKLRKKMDQIRRIKESGNHAPELEFIHVIHSKNYQELPKMIEMAADAEPQVFF